MIRTPLLLLASACLCLARDLPVVSADEFARVCASAQPGDTLLLQPGEWRDAALVFAARGTADSPITLAAAEPGKTKLTGRSRLTFSGEHLVARGLLFTEGYIDSGSVIQFGTTERPAHHCRLTESAIIAYNHPDRTKRYQWLQLTGRGHAVDHNRFEGGDHFGVTLQVVVGSGDNRHQIHHNAFLNRAPGTGNGYETIQLGQSQDAERDSHSVVEFNYFENCDGELEIISNKSCANTYRKNTFVRCAGALTLRHGHRSIVESNIFLGGGKAHTGGVRVIGHGHIVRGNYFHQLTGVPVGAVIALYAGIPNSPPTGYVEAKDALVEDNVLVSNPTNGVILSAGHLSRGRTVLPSGVTLRRNWFDLHPQAGGVVLAGTPGEALRCQDNYYSAHSEMGYAPPDGGFRQTPYSNPSNPDLPIAVQPEMSAPATSERDIWKRTLESLERLTVRDVGPSWWVNTLP